LKNIFLHFTQTHVRIFKEFVNT